MCSLGVLLVVTHCLHKHRVDDIINGDYRSLWCYMSSLIEMLCALAGKIGFVFWQLLHDLHATENLFFNLTVNFLYFLSN